LIFIVSSEAFYFSVYTKHLKIVTLLLAANVCFQCYDAVGWATGRASNM